MERIHFGNLRIASLLLTDHVILLVFNQSKTFSMHWSPLPSTSSDQSQHLQVWDYGSSGKWWNASSGWRRGLPQAREFLTREFEYVWFLFTYGRKIEYVMDWSIGVASAAIQWWREILQFTSSPLFQPELMVVRSGYVQNASSQDHECLDHCRMVFGVVSLNKQDLP